MFFFALPFFFAAGLALRLRSGRTLLLAFFTGLFAAALFGAGFFVTFFATDFGGVLVSAGAGSGMAGVGVGAGAGWSDIEDLLVGVDGRVWMSLDITAKKVEGKASGNGSFCYLSAFMIRLYWSTQSVVLASWKI